MNDVIQSAMNALLMHEAEAQRLRTFLRMYQEISETDVEGLDKIRRNGASFVIRETEKATVAIIVEKGRPVGTTELMGLLKDQGVVVGGKRPHQTLAARLSRSPSVQFQRGFGWTIVPEFERRRSAPRSLETVG